MTRKIDTAADPGPRASRAAWALVVTLALVQLAVAAHWSAHNPAALEDHCAICLQLDRLDQALSEDHNIAIRAREFAAAPAGPVDAASHQAPRYFAPRAPPLLRS